jgi:nucleotide-binding universal stress UspA family protein
MDGRERVRDRAREREWEERRGVWDEAEELVDEPPLPERLGRKVRRASREIGADVSNEVEKLGGRVREWSQDAGRKAERFTEGLGNGIERAGRTGRRWIAGSVDDYDSDEYDAEDKEERRWRRDKARDRQRLDEIDEEVGLRANLEKKKKIKPKVGEASADEEEERGARSGWSWFGGGWGKRKEEEERMPEERVPVAARSKSDVDLVCIDSSIASEQAFRYALRNIPRGHTLLLVHGIFTPPGAVDSKLEDENEMLRVKDKFMSLCQRNGRRCAYREFEYTTNNELGDKVCSIADRQNAGSVILGKRADASDLRRAVLGSPSLSVMQQCNAPVTLIAERKEGFIY